MTETEITSEEEFNYPRLIALMMESQNASNDLFVALIDMTEAIIRENKMLRERLEQYESGGVKND